MFDDLTKEIKAQLYERIRSPLLGTFALSWVAWNHRPIMAFFSDMSFQEKLTYFDNFYDQHPINYGVFFPLCSAILFVLIYPHPARWIYTYSATQQNKLKAVQVKIEDKTPLTQEEANVIRKVSLDQQADLQRQIRELSERNQELGLQLKQAVEQMPRSERQQEEDAFASSDDAPIVSNKIERIKTLAKPLREYLPEETLLLLSTRLEDQESALDVFLALISVGGKSHVETLKEILNVNKITVEHGIQILKKKGFVEYATGGSWVLTNQGREIAVNMKLTNLFT